MVSTTVIVCTQLEALPQLSVAIQVRSIVDSSAHAPGVTESEKPTDTVGSHTSELPAVPVSAGAVDSSHSIVISAGQTISGAVVSEMLAVLESVSVCPVVSVTVSSTEQFTWQVSPVSTVSVGVALVESSKLPPGQSVVQENDRTSPGSGSLDPVPSSARAVLEPPHSAL